MAGWVFVSVRGLSLVAVSGGHSSSRCAGLSLSRPLLLRNTGSRCADSVVVAHGLVAPRHVGSSQTRAQTRVPCIGRQILNHCATREAPCILLYALGNQKICVTCFVAISALLQWSRTEPTISLGYGCNLESKETEPGK